MISCRADLFTQFKKTNTTRITLVFFEDTRDQIVSLFVLDPEALIEHLNIGKTMGRAFRKHYVRAPFNADVFAFQYHTTQTFNDDNWKQIHEVVDTFQGNLEFEGYASKVVDDNVYKKDGGEIFVCAFDITKK